MTLTRKYTLIWGCFFLLLVALVLHIWQVYFMAASLALLAAISYLLARRSLVGLQCTRQSPPRIYSGHIGRVGISVTNTGIARRSLFQVMDTLPESLAVESDLPHLVVDLPSGATVQVEYDFTPLRRGVYALGPVRYITTDSLGIHEFTASDECFSTMIVYPTPLPLPDLWPQATASSGERTRRRIRGQGMEFRGVREYVPGDDLRRISWTNTARRGKLTVVETERGETMSATIVLDLSATAHRGEGDISSLEYGVTLAASLAHQASERSGAVGLIAVGAQDYTVPRSERRGQQSVILEALAHCQSDCPQKLSAVVASHEAMLTRAGNIAVISPATGVEAVALATRLASLGNTVSWFVLDGPSFVPQAREEHAAEARYAALAAALRGARALPHLISGARPLPGNFGGLSRAAS